MKNLFVSLAMLAMLSLPLYGAGVPDTAAPASAGQGMAKTADRMKPVDISNRSLSGIFTIRTLEGERCPALIDTSGKLVRLEGDIARQLAFGSEGVPISIKGYYFPRDSTIPSFVVTWLERIARKEDQDERL